MKILFLIAALCILISIGIVMWQIAQIDYCPVMYNIQCLPK